MEPFTYQSARNFGMMESYSHWNALYIPLRIKGAKSSPCRLFRLSIPLGPYLLCWEYFENGHPTQLALNGLKIWCISLFHCWRTRMVSKLYSDWANCTDVHLDALQVVIDFQFRVSVVHQVYRVDCLVGNGRMLN
jgi:hypothetical protein